MTLLCQDSFEVALAQTPEDLRAAQRLRYQVFVAEMGAQSSALDAAERLERDRFDAHCDHLLLRDLDRDPGDQVIGVYRLMGAAHAAAAGGFYSAGEYDLSPLTGSGLTVLELGRSCLRAEYRGGRALGLLWQALGRRVLEQGVDILFGVASFAGTDVAALNPALSLLRLEHAADPGLAPRAHGAGAVPLGDLAEQAIDRKAARRDTPALIKAYLRLGGRVGQGAFIDRAFNTTDVCMVLDVRELTPDQRARYAGQAAG